MPPDNKQTIFNSAIASLERIHNLLLDCNKYSRESRMSGYNVDSLNLWKLTVANLYNEVSPKLKKEEKKLIHDKFKSVTKLGPITSIKKTPDGRISYINPPVFNAHWNIINNVERILRKIADSRGMLIPDNTDDFFEPENW